MTSREKGDTSLPAIPENSEAKLRSTLIAADEEDDADDEQEQRLYDADNIEEDNDDDNKETSLDEENTNPTIAFTTTQTSNENGNKFYVQSATGGQWELTWPIWHLLPRAERREIATQYGMKTIGEFEEYMSLTRAVDESESIIGTARSGVIVSSASDMRRSTAAVDSDVSNNVDARREHVSGNQQSPDWHPPFIGGGDENDDSSVSSSETDECNKTAADSSSTGDLHHYIDLESNYLEIIERGGLPCTLPDEILHKCFAFLPIDDHANLSLVSPHWSKFTRCEELYETLCKRIYLNQSKRKVLHVNRFGHSYRRMLELRPRVRTGGLYVLKYQEVKKIQRDMWTEIPVGAVLESVYYRYLYFFEDGRVMYALTHAHPMEMIPRFVNMLLRGYGSKDRWGVWGKYEIKKDIVRVWARQQWHDVCFQMRVLPSNRVLNYDNGDRGVCTSMVLEKHMSSASGNFEDNSYDLVTYDVPQHCYFRFLRDRRL